MTELQVLHIVPRWSDGGATPTILSEAKHARDSGSGIRHRALTLEPGGSLALVKEALRLGLRLHVAPAPAEEAKIVEAAHVVVLHFWNTPSLRCFLDRWRGTPLRWMVHAHVNGVHQPQRLPPMLVSSACHAVLTSPLPNGIATPPGVTVIPAPADLVAVGEVGADTERGSIMHTGTLNVFKLSPHFVTLHAPVADAADPILVIGSGGDEERFQAEASDLGVAEGFRWLGFRSDLRASFASTRLLSYPVSSFSYASSDRVIQFAQSAGVPVLVQRDAPVAYLVRDGVTGILAADLDDFQRKLVAISRREIDLPERRMVAQAAWVDHDPAPKLAKLQLIYRTIEAEVARPVDDGFPDLLSWIDYQVGDVTELQGARRPPLSELRDDSVLARHQRWACEGGLAQYVNAFPGLADCLRWVNG